LIPLPVDEVEEYLRAAEEYDYHGEPELAEEMLVLAAQYADVSSDVWLVIEGYATLVDPELLRRLREAARG